MGVIVGTAGHIDHGKSQLVKYLTGTDPDRLKEEKERGITIELGYVFMPLPNGGLLSFIDVPGHENFVRQMVAGTATVDFFLLVVAADEGIMPQTREHLDVLNLLGVEKGLVAITKCDLVDPDMQELVEMDLNDHLRDTVFEGSPVYRVSSITGEGIEDLRDALVAMASEVGQRRSGSRFRLDVDRVFVLEGFGTIVAGTAISGSVSPGQEVELQPGGSRYRVRELRVNSRRDIPVGGAGDRIALNLVGLQKDDVYRGCCVAEPGYMKVRDSLDTSIAMLESAGALKRYQRVRFHTGTAEVMARAGPVEGNVVAPGTTGYAHFQLESPVAALPGDRFVIRSYSPMVTIGGGVILETGTRKVRKKYADERVSHLEVLESGDLKVILEEMLHSAGTEGLTAASAAGELTRPLEEIEDVLREMQDEGSADVIGSGSALKAVDGALFRDSCTRLKEALAEHHRKNPVSPGFPLSEPSRVLSGCPQWLVRGILEHLLESGVLERRGEKLALAEHDPGIPEGLRPAVDDMIEKVGSGGTKGMPVSQLGDTGLAGSLTERGLLHELIDGVLVSDEMARSLIEGVCVAFGDSGFTLAELRDHLGVSRKDALRWAEFFDGMGWTRRSGDKRLCRRS